MIRIKKSSVVVFLLLLCSMRWEINDYIGNNITQIIENILRIFAALYSVLLYVKNGKGNMKISLLFLILILMQGWLIFSTTINHGDLKACLVGYLIPLLTMGLLAESMQDNMDSFINGCLLFAEVLVYSNFLMIIIFPNGMYSTFKNYNIWYTTRNWLLGNKNLFLPYYLFACLVAFLHAEHGGKKLREWGIYVICFLSVIIVNSSTSIVTIAALIVLLLIIKTKKVKINVYFLLTINVILFFAIVVFRLQTLFSFLIEDILGKSLTFSGRTLLWGALIPVFKDNFLLGLGIQKNGVYQRIVGISYAGQAHNLILNNLYIGGIVYLSLHLIVMLLVYQRLHKFQVVYETQAMSAILFVFQISALMEAHSGFQMIFIYIIYIIAYHVNRFVPQEDIGFVSPKQQQPRLGKTGRME